MDFTELRSSGVQRFLKGDADQLSRQILSNSLNRIEREFLSEFVRSNVPKGPRGPRATSRKPLNAALVRFWRVEVDGWSDLDAVWKDIECRLGVSTTMARKYLAQIDDPKTEAQAVMSMATEFEIGNRRMAVQWDDHELIGLYREADLKPVSRK